MAITFAAYIPALNAGYVWDDDDYVTQNPVLRSADGLRRIWLEPTSLPQYYPLVHTTFWIEYRLWELDPRGYHATNVLLHALNSVLLLLVLRRLEVPLALLAAAIFALHPVHVESVAWITERKNTLSGLLFLLALLAWMKWRPIGAKAHRKAGPAGFYWLSLAAYGGALLSKTVTCSLPAVILLLIWWKRGSIARRDVIATLPYFAIGLAMASVTVLMEGEHVGASGAAWDLSALDRVLVAGKALWFYAWKLVWPVRLTFNYPRWATGDWPFGAYLYPAGVIALGAALWILRRRIGRGPLAAVLVFAGVLVPALGFFDVYPMVYSFVADHYQYLASIGLIVLGCTAAAALAERFGPAGRTALRVCGTALLLLLGGLTFQQSRIYDDLEVLWTDTIEKNPASWLALGNLGGLRVDQGRLEEARGLLEESLRLHEPNPYAHNNLGIVLLERGDRPAAREHFEISLRQRPDYPQAHNNLAVLEWRDGDLEAARDHLLSALELAPGYLDANRNLGRIYARLGDSARAIPRMEHLLRVNPRDTPLRLELAGLHLAEARYEPALAHYQAAALAQPGNLAARMGAVAALRALGRNEAALAEVSQVLALAPDHPGARRAFEELTSAGH